MSGTSRRTGTRTEGNGACSLAEKKVVLRTRRDAMFVGVQDDSGETGSTAPSSAMRAGTGAATSYAKRMRLLIASGLIAGITPTCVRSGRLSEPWILLSRRRLATTEETHRKRADDLGRLPVPYNA